ncbi:hypothetical protein ES319_D06G056100v1 [Gossypium barbadense]|uniref:Uncharacterized protein n=2 Tax=Gossypium TaxID=3633 RepID=A0A5J5QXX4_GOSBA|nr:hypothetical protein ES319_D06G056100v1 [Gossypium barbadense]PPD98270.1 hypothetical protein GOBAR_DD04697 [Gossypium barbadense]TYG63831.1 hypothetical protein ES288_D06G060800v1 [Gossypium darwinii]
MAADQMIFRCVFEGSISIQDCLIERRPYHRNCECALHNLKGICTSTCTSRTTNISFPTKQRWNDCFLSFSAAKFSSQSPLLPNASFTKTIEIIDSASVLYEREAEHS